MSDNNTIYNDMVQPRGPAYRSENVKPWSHYREPIDTNDGRLHGESRRWGDATPETQSRVIDSLMDASHKAGLSPRETAYVLAIARVESGFNPDAAAGTTSASGLGQFVDRTGAHYGVNNANRFDVDTQSRALVQHYIDNRDLAQRRGQGEDHIYKYHHDGPSKDYGGLAISRRDVTPYLDRYQQFVEQHQSRTQGQGQTQGHGQAQEQGRSQPHTAAPAQQPQAASHSNFQQTMERMLPSQGKVDPHITGHYGEQRARGPHGGTDFNYEGGQTGINRQHPTVHAPISGTVTFSGGQYGTVKIRDAQGNSHEILHLDSRSVKEGDTVRAGDAIGTMGGRGPNGASQYAQHVHYQMHDANGKAVSPETWWNRGRQVDAHARDQAQHGNGNGTLRQGDHGPEVRELQQHLNRLGIRDAQGRPLAEDGRFGDNTHEAVTALQKQRGLTQDGIVGRDTRAGLAAAEQAQAKPAKGPQLGEPGHPDTPLYDKMRTEADRGAEKANPPHAKLSNEAVANLTLQAKQAGIDSPDKLKEVNVANDKAFVAGTTPGFRAVVDLQQPAPPLEQTSAQLARQSAQQQESVQREQQQETNRSMARA